MNQWITIILQIENRATIPTKFSVFEDKMNNFANRQVLQEFFENWSFLRSLDSTRRTNSPGWQSHGTSMGVGIASLMVASLSMATTSTHDYY
jgi:hypothetical protein